MIESIKAMITGKAIYPVSSDDLRVLLSGTHSMLRLAAKPDEAVEEFMRRAFNDALSIEHVAQSTWQCIIYISPKWKKLSEDAINELETYIDRWCMDSEKRVSWGVYEDTSLHSPEILIIDNKAADTEASDDKSIVNKNRKDMIETIIFKDLYTTLIDDVAGIKGEKCAFFPQDGEDYQKEIVVIGRACNGYITSSLNIHTLFGTSEEAIVNRKDQMKWVEDCAGNKDGYNTNKSAFWRVTKRIAQKFYPNNWYSCIAWSNVCKIAPWKGGNPNNALYYAQLESCKKIFEEEVRQLSPKFVIMFTGEDWAKDFLLYLNKGKELKSIKELDWDKYKCHVYDINGTFFILTEHPQGKKEKEHAESIINFIKSML